MSLGVAEYIVPDDHVPGVETFSYCPISTALTLNNHLTPESCFLGIKWSMEGCAARFHSILFESNSSLPTHSLSCHLIQASTTASRSFSPSSTRQQARPPFTLSPQRKV